MLELGFETGIHYVPNHTHTLYKSSEPLALSEDIGRRLLSLPFHANMTLEDVEAVMQALNSSIQEL
jgi:dTDP-4-amino-4,6-dideoxygalactose transaminase